MLSAAPVWQVDDEGTAEMAHCVVLLMCTTLEVVVAEGVMHSGVAVGQSVTMGAESTEEPGGTREPKEVQPTKAVAGHGISFCSLVC